MKKLLLLFIALAAIDVHAQLTLNVAASGAKNFSNSFEVFRDKYNEVNADDLKNELGHAALFTGFDFEVNYCVLGLTSGVTRTYIHSGTSSKYVNGAKRVMDFEYKLTNAFIGGGFNLGERSELRIEVGMVHSVSSIYSKVKLPTGETDYSAGGASHESTWTNIGLSGRVMYIFKISDRWMVFGTGVFNRLMGEDTDIAPYLNYSDTKVTHTFQGVVLNAGIGFNLAPLVQ